MQIYNSLSRKKEEFVPYSVVPYERDDKDTKIIADTAFVGCAVLKDISYAGTEDEWKAIIKSENWSGDLVLNVVFG